MYMFVAPQVITPTFLHALREGELWAWERLYTIYSAKLYGYILQWVPPALAGSVLVSSFIQMYRRIHEFSADNERLFTWMTKITFRNSLMQEISEEDGIQLGNYIPNADTIQVLRNYL